ncbi:MAG TPA: ABC transporter permease [Polyangiaceae bacterium]|nr:ABC transporter permease [Polyangiaceae bacterium]HNZ22818.1 ABC transporter permease [Polyangiaceae bacterium]HOD24759.1 ABC transporter permease [Polyangiaceae bacterium]HOE47716.1 ABC transporter permease [Polyangiaceae bacterium]HOH01231.1 ABC transporter permease [Polyangiaceae bacterium]
MKRLRGLAAQPYFGPAVALFATYLLFGILSPETFWGVANFTTMLRQTVVVGIAAIGMTMVMIHGGIDLSVGSGVALATVVVALLLRAGLGPVGSSLVAIAVCALAGVGMGVLITRLRVTPFIITLGGMSMLRGLAKGLAGEQKIDADSKGLDRLMAPGTWAVLPAGVWIGLAIALIAGAVLVYTRFGKHVFAVGSNEQTARLCGVEVSRIRIAVYGLAALLTGIAGIMEFSTLTVGDPTDSFGLELEVIAAVVIGGGSLSGGEGSIVGSLLGALWMTVIKTGGTHLGLPNWVQEIATGAIIVAAVAVDRWRKK